MMTISVSWTTVWVNTASKKNWNQNKISLYQNPLRERCKITNFVISNTDCLRLDGLPCPHENPGEHRGWPAREEPPAVCPPPPLDALPVEPRVPQGHRQPPRAALHREGKRPAQGRVQVQPEFGPWRTDSHRIRFIRLRKSSYQSLDAIHSRISRQIESGSVLLQVTLLTDSRF